MKYKQGEKSNEKKWKNGRLLLEHKAKHKRGERGAKPIWQNGWLMCCFVWFGFVHSCSVFSSTAIVLLSLFWPHRYKKKTYIFLCLKCKFFDWTSIHTEHAQKNSWNTHWTNKVCNLTLFFFYYANKTAHIRLKALTLKKIWYLSLEIWFLSWK